ncbi:DUF6372 family protein [Kitasatospora kifunensis]
MALQWEQHAPPGGCRCLCRFFHKGPGFCGVAAEPGSGGPGTA